MYFQARKNLPLEKLEHLKSQLDASAQQDLISHLEELILKLEPLDSACSSRRSSISSHVSALVVLKMLPRSFIFMAYSHLVAHFEDESFSFTTSTLRDNATL